MNVKWHTEGRRQPILVGKDASGHNIPGGPYIVWQGLALPIAPIMWFTRHSWASGLSGLAVLVVIAGTTGLAFWLIGQIDWSGRNPTATIPAAVAALTRVGPRSARLNRRPVRTRHQTLRHTPHTIWHTQTNPAPPDDQPATTGPDDTPDPTPPAAPGTPAAHLSPLEQFIATAGKV